MSNATETPRWSWANWIAGQEEHAAHWIKRYRWPWPTYAGAVFELAARVGLSPEEAKAMSFDEIIHHAIGTFEREIAQTMPTRPHPEPAANDANPTPENKWLKPKEAQTALAAALTPGNTDHPGRALTARFETLRKQLPDDKKRNRGNIIDVDATAWDLVCKAARSGTTSEPDTIDEPNDKELIARVEAAKAQKNAPPTPVTVRTYPNERARKAAEKNGV